MAIDDNQRSREAVLARVRERSVATAPTTTRARPRTPISPRASRARGPRCRRTSCALRRARARTCRAPSNGSATLDEVPPAVVRYLRHARHRDAANSDRARRVLARIRRPGLAGRGVARRIATDGRPRRARHHRLLLRDRRNGHARVRYRRRRRRRRRSCCPRRMSRSCAPTRSLPRWRRRSRASAASVARIAARGQSRVGPVAHRRHRADDRARRARPAPAAYRAGRLSRG